MRSWRSVSSADRFRALTWPLLTCGLLTLLLTLIFANAAFSQIFDSETKLRNTVKIPAAIQAQLERSEEVAQCLRQGDENTRFSPSWFQATKIDLNDDGRSEYVVKSAKDCLYGPRAATWWIFSPSGRGFRQVFYESVISFALQKRRTHGFRDIRTETVMMNIIRNTWRYDGREYKLVKTRIIEPGK